jgi:hypothetical protein
MSLGEKRRRFTHNLALLVLFAEGRGYGAAVDMAKRCEDCPVGHQNSLHKLGLAVDINLYRDGVYLTETDDHKELGEFWKSLDPNHAWGGDFNDGNHYSSKHQGMK